MASRSLDDLATPVKEAAIAMQVKCAEEGIDLLIYCTLRTNEEQTELFAKGRTVPGGIVTMARAGESMHNPDSEGKSWAFDAVPLVDGECAWRSKSLIQKVGRIGESCGLKWAGRWTGALREAVHYQMDKPPLEPPLDLPA